MTGRRRIRVTSENQPPAAPAGGWSALAFLLLGAVLSSPGASAQAATPVLDFPEPGLDDPAAYEGYATRFFRDAAGNTLQVYIDGRDGRVVSVWANAANESVAFTARDASDRPAAIRWGSDAARTGADAAGRWVEYDLVAAGPEVRLGLFLLGTMRWERDVQYQGRHRGALDQPLRIPELEELVRLLGALDAPERARHLSLLRAPDLPTLRARLDPALSLERDGATWRFRASQPSLDAGSGLVLDLSTGAEAVEARLEAGVLTLRSVTREPIRLAVRVTTDAEALTPLGREEIFSADFLRFVDEARPLTGADDGDPELRRGRRLERQVRAAELLSSREKLMAGLPNYGTYFGRDMLMTALMMEPVWSPSMSQHVIASVLRKLGPDGGVSHEEALGGQAVREAAAEYNALLERYRAERERGADAAGLLARAGDVLEHLSRTRENHRMLDDDLQLPVLVARWLSSPRVAPEEKHHFLVSAPVSDGASALELIVRNLALVARSTERYAAEPRPEHLIGFPRERDGRWFPGSWRDSGPGYANGRYALDVNAIWAPHALAAMASILDALAVLGLAGEAERAVAELPDGGALRRYLDDPAALRRATRTWRDAASHFAVELDPAAVEAAVEQRLAALPPAERDHWRRTLGSGGARAALGPEAPPLRFFALALDSVGEPIPVLSTDPAMALYLGTLTETLGGAGPLQIMAPILAPYPVGLMVPGLGPLVANDAYAPPPAWAAFEADPYHSPRTVWGREVNLLLLGLAARIAEAHDERGRLRDPRLLETVTGLREALQRIWSAVASSGLAHNELWSYAVDGSGLRPVRYGTSTDIQLWNVTDLAVEYVLHRLPPPIP